MKKQIYIGDIKDIEIDGVCQKKKIPVNMM